MKPWAVLTVGLLAAALAFLAVLSLEPGSLGGDRTESTNPDTATRGEPRAVPKATPQDKAPARRDPPAEGDISEETRDELREWLRNIE